MASPKKVAAKLPAKTVEKLVEKTVEFELFKLETNVPMPERGVRDPEFLKKINDILAQIKPRQSFVIPRVKLHTVKKIIKTNYAAMIVKSAVIKPQEQFARLWRVR